MKEHDHVVSFWDGGYDSGSHLNHASRAYDDWFERWPDRDWGERFNFCPECGVALTDFWKRVDSMCAAYQAKMDREHEQGRDYRNTPPT